MMLMAGTDVACIDKRAYVHLSASAVDGRDVSDRERERERDGELTRDGSSSSSASVVR